MTGITALLQPSGHNPLHTAGRLSEMLKSPEALQQGSPRGVGSRARALPGAEGSVPVLPRCG